MVITWYGLSSFKISSGNLTLVTDPFSKSVGLTPPRVQTDIAVISNIENPSHNNKKSLGGSETFVIDGPGEYDVKGLFVRGIAASGGEKKKEGELDHTTIYAIRMEDIRLGFLGNIKQKQLTDSQLEQLEDIDILFVPVGGVTVLDAEEAVATVNQLEPQIVVPMHYQQKGLKLKLEKLDHFLKEIGSKPSPQEKLAIKKSDFAGKQTEVVVLTPQR